MPFTVQTPGAAVAGANAYITFAEFQAYHADRGNDVQGAAQTEVEQAIVRATDYIDMNWNFLGLRTFDGQTLEWPRVGVFTRPELDDVDDQSVPEPVKRACAELALAALGFDLDPNVPGVDQIVTATSKRAGDLAISTSFGGLREGSPRWNRAAKYLVPFTCADELMRA
jgi:hypothetical protein